MLYYSNTKKWKSQEKFPKKVDKITKKYYDNNIKKEEVIHFSPYLCGKRLINILILVNKLELYLCSGLASKVNLFLLK